MADGMMKYQHVCLESIGYSLPEEIVTSEQIESWLAPLYTRLRLSPGRLELMTGIRERRFWPRGMLPSEKSVESGERALAAAEIDRAEVGALIHASVCRDYLEPATACSVHHRLGLPSDCLVYDVSNACLGILNGIVQVANMIELGQIRAGLVVGTEGSRQLVETTIEQLNSDVSLSRADLKRAIASLTIGSGSAAVLLTHSEYSRTQNRILGAVARTATEHHALCHSGRDESVAGDMRPLMDTDSERLMEEGIRAGAETFAAFLNEAGWSVGDVDKTFCHQVGTAHRKLMLAALGLDPRIDFPTVETLGNTGSVALPLAMALGIEQGHLKQNDRVALLGIGSGINALMLGMQWQGSSRRESTVEAREAAIDRILKSKVTLGPDLTIRQLIEEGRR
ncbi:MAG TPA: 3-oxoacyl-ACP synthase III [Pirellulales bacterium]|jgi:3-oxoacyl-[acyl-carrier-protein] synthase-3|nr:3-oxoacyl-ACP synthase III [Pirellulales bacterium]